MLGEASNDFAQWFTGSKVVDQHGRPLKMFHGTHAGFEQFHPGSHFGSIRAANQRVRYTMHHFPYDDIDGSRVLPVYLRITNPLRVTDIEASDEATLLNAIARGKYPDIDLDLARNEGAYKAAQAAGYDGLVYKNRIEDRGHLSYVVFHPSQVRSAITDRSMLREATSRRFYHSSVHALSDGTILAPQNNNRMTDWIEQRLELNKPAGSLSRSDAVFMVDDILMLPGVGAALAWVYEIEPLGKVERHDANWLIEMRRSQPEDVASSARSYWQGKGTNDPIWEYLTSRARIIRLAFDYDEQSGQFEPQP